MSSSRGYRPSFPRISTYVVVFALAAPAGLRAAPVDPCCGNSSCCGGPQGHACRLDYGANGTVSDIVTGEPIPGATVEVLDLTPTTTAADGSFSLAGSRADVCGLDYFYTFRATADGYEPYELTVYTSAVMPTLQVQLTPRGHIGYTVSGYVAESSGCSGRMRGVTVTLNPLGVSTQTTVGPDGGLFAFDNVPPGDYTLTVNPSCNPFGCWDVQNVTVVDHDEQVSICIAEELGLVEVSVSGEEAAPGATFEVATRLRSQGNQVYRVAHTIALGDTPIQTTTGGDPDCSVNPEIGAETSSFELRPDGCSGAECTELRAVVESTDRPLSDGVLYTCNAEMTFESSTTCEHRLLCEDLSATSGGESPLESRCTDGTAISSYPDPQVTFTFDIEPEHPAVGDQVTITVHARLSGFGGLPTYTLLGAEPFFAGDTSPIHESQFIGDLRYELEAVGGGRAELVLSVNYETRFGCPGNESFNFTNDTSEPFVVDVEGPPAPVTPTFTATTVPDTPTPTLTPCHFATPPLCPVGQEPHCISNPCTVGCSCKPCAACPAGEMYSGDVNRCDCVPIFVATVSATPDATRTNTPCAQPTLPLCVSGEHPQCQGSGCSTVCACVPDVSASPTETDVRASGDGSGGGCAITVPVSDSPSALWLAPIVLLAVLGRRARRSGEKRPFRSCSRTV